MKRMGKAIKGIAIAGAIIMFVNGVYLPNITFAEEVVVKQDIKARIDNIMNPVKLEVSSIPAGNAYIPKGTIIEVELVEELSSKKNHVDDNVRLKTLDNIIINDVVIVPAGAEVEGKVTKCTSSGLFGRAGKLEFTINSVRSINGIDIPLQYTDLREAGSDDGAVAVAAVVTLIGGLFMKGKNVSFPVGTKMAAKVVADTDLKVRLDNLAEIMNPAKPHGVVIQINQ